MRLVYKYEYIAFSLAYLALLILKFGWGIDKRLLSPCRFTMVIYYCSMNIDVECFRKEAIN